MSRRISDLSIGTQQRNRALRALVAVCAVIALSAGGAQSQEPASQGPASKESPKVSAQLRPPAQVALIPPPTAPTNMEAAIAERKKQIADDSTKLFKLATELKTEVDKTTKDTLSLTVVRKADEIEHMAHGVKEKMKTGTGSN